MKKCGGSFGKVYINLQMSANKLILLWTITWLIWGFGLLEPLTPSVEAPSLSATFSFIGLPILLNIIGFFKSWKISSEYEGKEFNSSKPNLINNVWLIVFFGIQTIAIVSFSFYLLIVQSGAISA